MNTFLKDGHDEYNAIVRIIQNATPITDGVLSAYTKNISVDQLQELIQVAQNQLARNITSHTQRIQRQLRIALANKDLTIEDMEDYSI